MAEDGSKASKHLQAPISLPDAYLWTTATYKLIHSFLVAQGHREVAAALKKSVKGTVVLKGDAAIVAGSNSLEEIIKEWKASQKPVVAKDQM